MMRKAILVLSVIIAFLLISCNEVTCFRFGNDAHYVEYWKQKYQDYFLESNPDITEISFEGTENNIWICIRGTISDWFYLRPLLLNLTDYCLCIENADEMEALRDAKRCNGLIIGIQLKSSYLEYKNLSFIKNTSIANLHLWHNVVLNSLSGIEDSKVTRLAIFNAKYIKDYHLLKQTDIESLTLKNATHLSDFNEIGKMKRLWYLSVSGANISNLLGLKNNDTITHLSVSNCSINDLSSISSLKKLTSFSVSNAPIEDLAPLIANDKLERIYISGTLVKDLSPLKYHPNLKKIYVDKESVHKLIIPPSLKPIVDVLY